MNPHISYEDLKLFVGKNSEYYLSIREKLLKTKGVISWNWAAFFFSIVWMAYRNLYVPVAIGCAIYIIGAVMKSQGVFFDPVLVPLPILLGLLGNNFYLWHAEKQVASIKKEAAEGAYERELRDAGGTSWPLMVLTLIILMLFGTYTDSTGTYIILQGILWSIFR